VQSWKIIPVRYLLETFFDKGIQYTRIMHKK
jgi:hypothetical protein